MLGAMFNAVEVPDDMAKWYKRRQRNQVSASSSMKQRPQQPDIRKLKSLMDLQEIKRRFWMVTRCARRQSNRDMPKTPFKNGVMDLTHLTGQEYPGLCLTSMVAMKGLLSSNRAVQETDILEKRFVLLLFLSLSMHMMLSKD